MRDTRHSWVIMHWQENCLIIWHFQTLWLSACSPLFCFPTGFPASKFAACTQLAVSGLDNQTTRASSILFWQGLSSVNETHKNGAFFPSFSPMRHQTILTVDFNDKLRILTKFDSWLPLRFPHAQSFPNLRIPRANQVFLNNQTSS
jgi:hypothetical protein